MSVTFGGKAAALLAALVLLQGLAVPACGASETSAASRTVRLGVMSFRGEGGFTTHIRDEDRMLARVPDWLGAHVPGARFETRFYRMNDLMRAVERKDVDVFLASSGFFWQMKPQGVRDLATIVSDRAPDPNRGVAGLIFTRADRGDVASINDLRGKRVSTGLENMFLATQLSMAEVARVGGDPERFCSLIRRHDSPYPAVIEDVLSGASDAGVIRACVLESEMPGWRSRLKPVGEKSSGDFACARSTDTYPNWTMAAVSGLDPELSKSIAVALLTMPRTAPGGYRWSFATDFAKVDQVSRLLKADGYSYLKEWTLRRLWAEHREALGLVALCLLAFLAHVWRVERLVARRTAELTGEMHRREASEASLRAFEGRMEAARKMSIVGELSSLLAHEIRQPLASIQYLADGIRVLLRRGNPEPAKLQRCADGIVRQVGRINAVVSRVRSYAKEEQRRDSVIDFSTLASEVAGKVPGRSGAPAVRTEIEPGVFVKGDRLELELALANLMKNGAEAAGPEGEMAVTLERGEGAARLEIENSGKILNEAELARLLQPFASQKKTGLGLGIPIVRSIAEAHRGSLAFAKRPGGGVIAVLKLPLLEEST